MLYNIEYNRNGLTIKVNAEVNQTINEFKEAIEMIYKADKLLNAPSLTKTEKVEKTPITKVETMEEAAEKAFTPEPASEKQIALMKKLKVNIPEGCTKKQASEILDALNVHGKDYKKEK